MRRAPPGIEAGEDRPPVHPYRDNASRGHLAPCPDPGDRGHLRAWRPPCARGAYSLMECKGSDSPGNGLGLGPRRRGLLNPLQPWRRLEPRKDLARLIQEALSLTDPSLRDEPLAVLEQGGRHGEGGGELSEHPGGCLEQLLDQAVRPPLLRKAGSEALRLRIKERRQPARRDLFHYRQELLRLRRVSKGQCRLGRQDERFLDDLRPEPEQLPVSERLLGCLQCVFVPAFRASSHAMCYGERRTLLDIGGRLHL